MQIGVERTGTEVNDIQTGVERTGGKKDDIKTREYRELAANYATKRKGVQRTDSQEKDMQMGEQRKDKKVDYIGLKRKVESRKTAEQSTYMQQG